jgi:hypothetical protein
MRVNTYALLSDKVDEGIRGGLMKAEKWNNIVISPGIGHEEQVVEVIHNYIMNAICEYADFDDEFTEKLSDVFDRAVKDNVTYPDFVARLRKAGL